MIREIIDAITVDKEWHRKEEWIRVETQYVHEVVAEHDASCDVRLKVGAIYRHRETGEERRHVTTGAVSRHTKTVFGTREEIESETLDWGRYGESRPKAQWTEQKKYQMTVTIGEDDVDS